MNQYEEYIIKSRYAKYLEEEQRRETWEETVKRYIYNVVEPSLPAESFEAGIGDKLYNAIERMEVLPSMRGLMTAGAALDRDNTAIFNCAYLPIDHQRAFDEALHILMCGTGVGFSVERQFIAKLPEVPEEINPNGKTIVVEDSKQGWAKALRKLIGALYDGDLPSIDYSKLRPAGARLKTFGGRASGPGPLKLLFEHIIHTFRSAKGRRLNSFESHSIMCKIGESVVSGGVRRSALISLSNLSDDRMRHAKSGQWGETSPELGLANNSVAYTEKPDFDSFLREMVSLYESKSGERGIFFRGAAEKQATKNGRREGGKQWGTNPCSEIILRPNQFCNLSTVVVRPEDSLSDLLRKVELATILGTIQATFTNFQYLRPIWKKNTEEEALLGVSLTGIMDHPVLSQIVGVIGNEVHFAKDWLEEMKWKAINTNKEWAEKLGIKQSAAITCVKPEGTVSQATNTASGMHARYAKYYIRRVRGDVKDPLTTFMREQGVPCEEVIGSPGQMVFSFPIAGPEEGVFRNDMTAIQQMEHWLMVQNHWCEHKPSITVYYGPEEFLGLMQWVWDHFDSISGVAFLPRDSGTYRQAPYEEISKEKYEELQAAMPVIDWEQFVEVDDNTIGSQTLACGGSDSCEII